MPNFNLFGFNFNSPDSYTTSTFVEDGMTFVNEFPVYTKTQTISMTTSTYTNDHVTIVNEFPVFSQSYTASIAKTTLTDSDGTIVLENWGGASWSTSINSDGETIINAGSGDFKTESWSVDLQDWGHTEEIHTTIAEANQRKHHSYGSDDSEDNFFGDSWPFKRDETTATSTSTSVSTSSSGSASSLYAQETGSNLVEKTVYFSTSSPSDDSSTEAAIEAAQASAAAQAGKSSYVNSQTIVMPSWAIAITVIGSIGFLILGAVLLWLIARKRRSNSVQVEDFYYPQHVVVGNQNPFEHSVIISQEHQHQVNGVSPPAYHQQYPPVKNEQSYTDEKH
ncbi:hypothetical protein WICPIJ_005651 [Wickerhamomyces pijperi]|uniref:Mid2 domain-containing protein n=1 Tax=Wickerhamomyces pijperi TaxID=599730 RepID=A0A9P8Q5R6_WICPI|nr:hypothetical protein WICPIJ_005651 [Wickerhamomyces pijperi]